MTTQELFDLAIHTIETAQKITKLGGPTAEVALKAIESVVDMFMQARAGHVVDVGSEITKLHDALAVNDATIDAVIGDRR